MLGLATSTFKTFTRQCFKIHYRLWSVPNRQWHTINRILSRYVSMSPLTAVEQAEHDRTSVCDNWNANFSSTHCSDIRHRPTSPPAAASPLLLTRLQHCITLASSTEKNSWTSLCTVLNDSIFRLRTRWRHRCDTLWMCGCLVGVCSDVVTSGISQP